MVINKVSFRYNAEELRQAIPIADVISYYTGVDTSNSERKQIKCPFPNHKDQHPSAKIYHDTNTCSCFACGQGGDIITLVRAIRQVDFKEACRTLISDFNLNEYEYSNKAEYEAYLEAKKGDKPKYIDVFPLNNDELKTIGIYHNGGIVTNEYFDKEGDVIATQKFQAPTVQKMWTEDKYATEDWLIEMADTMMKQCVMAKEIAEIQVEVFFEKYSADAIEKGEKAWEDISKKITTGEIEYKNESTFIENLEKTSPVFAEFLIDRMKWKDNISEIAITEERICEIMEVKEKILNHIEERKQHEKTSNKFRNWKEQR